MKIKDNSQTTGRRIAVLGGGLAGLASAWSARQTGASVVLFERGRHLGGRASSLDCLLDRDSPALIDNGEHLWHASCRALDQFHRELGLDRFFEKQNALNFSCGPNRVWSLRSSRWLPARFRFLPSFLSCPSLNWSERWNLAHVAQRLLQQSVASSDLTFDRWYREQGGLPRPATFFWRPLIMSCLAEEPESVGVDAVQTIFQEGFFARREPLTFCVPICPLREIYHDAVLAAFSRNGIEVRLLSRVERLLCPNGPVSEVVLADGCREPFDDVICALGPFAASDLLTRSGLTAIRDRVPFEQYELGAITTVHLWFDRPITTCKSLVLAGEPGQRLFVTTGTSVPCGDWSCQVVIGASHRLLGAEELTARFRNELVERVCRQLADQFPAMGQAQRTAYQVTTVLDAVVSPSPASFSLRPGPDSGLINLFLAGDWTRPDWPSTMEAAVRSGVLAGNGVNRAKSEE